MIHLGSMCGSPVNSPLLLHLYNSSPLLSEARVKAPLDTFLRPSLQAGRSLEALRVELEDMEKIASERRKEVPFCCGLQSVEPPCSLCHTHLTEVLTKEVAHST